jgi:hypothetical protein
LQKARIKSEIEFLRISQYASKRRIFKIQDRKSWELGSEVDRTEDNDEWQEIEHTGTKSTLGTWQNRTTERFAQQPHLRHNFFNGIPLFPFGGTDQVCPIAGISLALQYRNHFKHHYITMNSMTILEIEETLSFRNPSLFIRRFLDETKIELTLCGCHRGNATMKRGTLVDLAQR